jgi:hypothetical protein
MDHRIKQIDDQEDQEQHQEINAISRSPAAGSLALSADDVLG